MRNGTATYFSVAQILQTYAEFHRISQSGDQFPIRGVLAYNGELVMSHCWLNCQVYRQTADVRLQTDRVAKCDTIAVFTV